MKTDRELPIFLAPAYAEKFCCLSFWSAPKTIDHFWAYVSQLDYIGFPREFVSPSLHPPLHPKELFDLYDVHTAYGWKAWARPNCAEAIAQIKQFNPFFQDCEADNAW